MLTRSLAQKYEKVFPVLTVCVVGQSLYNLSTISASDSSISASIFLGPGKIINFGANAIAGTKIWKSIFGANSIAGGLLIAGCG